jgi:hypothetical protein
VGEIDWITLPQQAVTGEGGHRLPHLGLRQAAEFGQRRVLELAAEHGENLGHQPLGGPPLTEPQQGDPGEHLPRETRDLVRLCGDGAHTAADDHLYEAAGQQRVAPGRAS